MRALLIVLGLATIVGAADQTILGKQFQVKDPKPGIDATKRAVLGQGKEKGSPNTVVGDPTAMGAALTVFANGTTSSSQTFTLPAPLWTAVNGGFKYKDAKLTLGPVKTAAIKLAKGTFQLQAAVSGKAGGIGLVPPDTGSDGCVLFEITGGDRYHVRFPPAPDSTIKKNDAKAFVMKDATAKGVCPQTCTAGAPGCGWEDGDVITYSQEEWGDPTTPAGLSLSAHYDAVYAGSFGVLEVGIPGAAGFSMQFLSSAAVSTYLPDFGPLGALASDHLNPTVTASGAFGSEVTTLALNVQFADAGFTLGTPGVPFGDVTVCGLAAQPLLNGRSVRELLATVSTALGGGTSPYPIPDLYLLLDSLNHAFDAGIVTTFGDDHLILGACP